MNGIKRLAAFCKKAHKNNLLVSNTFATVSLLGVGDMLTQYIEHKLADKSSPKIFHQELYIRNDLAMLALDQGSLAKSEMNNCTVTVTMEKATKESFLKNFDWKRSGK